MVVGIYAIEHIATGRAYVGASVNVSKRWSRHIGDLETGAHVNIFLQAAWKEYGRTAFRFYVLERCDRPSLRRREQEWLTGLDATVSGFNMSPVSGWHPHTDLSRSRLAAALRGRPRPQHVRDAISAANKGRVFSLDHRRALKEARMHRIVTAETREKVRHNSLHMSAETRDKLRLAASNRKRENGRFASA